MANAPGNGASGAIPIRRAREGQAGKAGGHPERIVERTVAESEGELLRAFLFPRGWPPADRPFNSCPRAGRPASISSLVA